MVGKWIDQDVLNHVWFENLRCGIRETEIFRYGKDGYLKALIADDNHNLIVFNMEALKAEKLVDFHLGSQVNSIKKRNEQPHIASDDGCIRRILPIHLKDY